MRIMFKNAELDNYNHCNADKTRRNHLPIISIFIGSIYHICLRFPAMGDLCHRFNPILPKFLHATPCNPPVRPRDSSQTTECELCHDKNVRHGGIIRMYHVVCGRTSMWDFFQSFVRILAMVYYCVYHMTKIC